MSTKYQRNLFELREIVDKNEMDLRAELAKHGVPFSPEGNEKGDFVAYRADLRRVVNSLREKALAVTGGDGKWSEKDQAEYQRTTKLMDALSASIDICNLEIEVCEMVRNPTSGGNGQSWNRAGHEVKVLGRGDKFTDGKSHASRAGFGFGEFIASMVRGTNNPDIRASLSEGTDSAGGYTVPSHLMREMIDAMRARTVAVQAGALTIPLETEKTTIARLDSDPAAGWRMELGNVAAGNPTFGAVSFQARSLACLVKVSRELLEDSINIDSALMQAFAGAMAVELDRVALFGSGTAPEPRGVFNTTGVSVVSMGANGAALTGYGNLLDAIYELEAANAGAPTAMVMAPRTSRVLNGLVDSTGQPLNAPAAVTAVPRLVSTVVPINQTQGTATNASTVVVGDFSNLLIGVRTQLRIEVIRELFASTMEYAFLAHLRADVAVAQPKSFALIKGVIPA